MEKLDRSLSQNVDKILDKVLNNQPTMVDKLPAIDANELLRRQYNVNTKYEKLSQLMPSRKPASSNRNTAKPGNASKNYQNQSFELFTMTQLKSAEDPMKKKIMPRDLANSRSQRANRSSSMEINSRLKKQMIKIGRIANQPQILPPEIRKNPFADI